MSGGMKDIPTKDQVEIARRVKDYVSDAGVNQKQVAERIKRSEEFVNKLLNGKAKMTAEYLKKIADALGVEVEALLADRRRPDKSVSHEEQHRRLQILLDRGGRSEAIAIELLDVAFRHQSRER